MRILVVEDQPDLHHTLAQAMRRDGYAVDSATDGSEGLWKALEISYDAIVLDMILPQMEGWEILKRLRERTNTPVLLLTAWDALGDRIRALDAGADDYLTKPCDLDELLARLRALLRRSAGHPRPTIEIGTVVFDLADRIVRRHRIPVVLTAREYALAEFLAMRRGKVVTRSALHEHLLDDGDATQSNLVDVHVHNLRRKLGADFILTRRGIGYWIP